MTEFRTYDQGRVVRSIVGFELPEKPVLQFLTWAHEAVYLKIPADDYIHEGDLVALLAYTEQAKKHSVPEECVRSAIIDLCRGNWIQRYSVDDTLARTSHERAIVLNWT